MFQEIILKKNQFLFLFKLKKMLSLKIINNQNELLHDDLQIIFEK
jgi:hypothetical protein